tara:strand:+ start:373 stop:510 length:138 start_codon:yes stop_codon:yes gene_type:complete
VIGVVCRQARGVASIDYKLGASHPLGTFKASIVDEDIKFSEMLGC